MSKIKLNQDWCKGCGLCIEVCPKKVYDRTSNISSKGFREIVIKNPDVCNACLLCELLCPDIAITIETNNNTSKSKITNTKQ